MWSGGLEWGLEGEECVGYGRGQFPRGSHHAIQCFHSELRVSLGMKYDLVLGRVTEEFAYHIHTNDIHFLRVAGLDTRLVSFPIPPMRRRAGRKAKERSSVLKDLAPTPFMCRKTEARRGEVT